MDWNTHIERSNSLPQPPHATWVNVYFFTVLREITAKKEEMLRFPENQKVTINLILKTLTDRYGKPFAEYVFDADRVRGFLQFFINGQSASALNGLESELHDGDVLAIVPPVGGG
jgi:molybdopterin synthase sulfur carrier subunit